MKLTLLSLCLAAAAAAQPHHLSSPSGAVAITLDLSTGRALYSVAFQGREAILPSALGLGLEGAARLDSNFRLVRSTPAESRSSWIPPYGERAEFPDRYNSLTVELHEEIPPHRTLSIEFRAYDEGAAFRYRVPEQPGLAAFTLGDESTEFRLAKGAFGWDTPTAQGLYRRIPIDQLTTPSQRPFLVELAGGLWAAIAEAGVEDYPAMFLTSLRADHFSLAAKLMGPARLRAPSLSPWRVILLGLQPGDLLEHNYLLQNLSPPSRLSSTSWIRPGKVIREITLSTRGGREAVDFAARNGIQYIEYDAGWYGHEYDDASDATRVAVDPQRLNKDPSYQGLDLPQVIAYAKSKNIGVILYINRQAMERQLDAILPVFESWGVAGVKYGFVNVNTQPWTSWLYDAVRKAADHHLFLDIHDEFRPTGLSRTFPNLLTQEGIRGNEEFPNAAHSTILPFTRMLAGAADYTYCWLDPRLKNTWAHQLALSVVLYSPLQFLYWYDRPVSFTQESPGMEWFRNLPTVWDDTRVLAGRPGEFAAIARRQGSTWFLGVVNNDSARDLQLPLPMLDPGRAYTATFYSDGEGPRDIRKSVKTYSLGDTLELPLQPRGGVAITFTPIPR